MAETEAPRILSFRLRLAVAALTSLAGSLLVFVVAMAFVVAAAHQLAHVAEPAASVLMYGIATGLAGMAILLFDGRVLRLRWLGTAKAMLLPYLVVATVPLVGAAVHGSLSRNSFGFAHSWAIVYLLPMTGALPAAVLAAGSLAVEAARRVILRELTRRHGEHITRAG